MSFYHKTLYMASHSEALVSIHTLALRGRLDEQFNQDELLLRSSSLRPYPLSCKFPSKRIL